MAPRIFTDKQESEIARLYVEDGLSSRAIAKMYGIRFHTTIRSALKRQGVQFRKPQDANRLYNLDPHVFDKIDNEHAAYWLGFLYADGYINFRTLSVTLKGSDEKFLHKLKLFASSEAPIAIYLVKNKYPTARLDMTDRHMASRLNDLGIVPRRTKFDRITSQVPTYLYQHWIRGLFDGDGCAHKKTEISFCGSHHLMEFVRLTLHQQSDSNPDLKIQKHTTAQLYYLRYSGRNVALNVANFMYQDATIWMERKRKIVESWPEPQTPVRDSKGRYV